ncbi:uncharacterized protein LOC128885821 [Hylaeus anthracinus]|uniref:uncharacterized protein LOC128885821 n=1 Tax=Hylaeus anthracinus TaxID=313031 RepID=UPI0023B952BE|nr:uncharacterized protein LOC128885821 [Hylaeus anthracinus]
MCFRILAAKVLLLSLLVSASSIRSKDLEDDRNESASEEVKPIEQESFEEASSENEFSLQSATTTEYTTTVVTYGKIRSFVASQKNVSEEFRPSAPLGEIKESRINGNPFDNAHHVKFENDHDPNSYREQLENFQLVIQPTSHSDQTDQHGNLHQSFFGTVSGSSEEGKKEGAEQTAYVTFHTDPIGTSVPMIHYGSLKDQQFHQQFVQPIAENVGTQRDPMDQKIFENLQKPVYEQNAPTFFQKPSKFHSETQKHESGSFASIDHPSSPYFGGAYDHQIHRPVSHDFGVPAPNKPINGVVYAQESTFMRTRKFPYSFYQPAVGYHQIEFVNNDQPVYPVRKRVSPWKKILHLIGAFLPFGLLLAALTPTVVKVNNTTEPNIVLSKLRVADLPVEHKQARFIEEPPTVCEERSICELISVGDQPGSSVLQNLLWNLATRTSTTVAKENGLRDVFEAVKKKDCTRVAC